MHALTFYQAMGLPNLVKYSWHLLDSIMVASQFVLKLSVSLIKAPLNPTFVLTIYIVQLEHLVALFQIIR